MDVKFRKTGEVRPPKENEWFLYLGHYNVQAAKDIEESHPILEMIVLSEGIREAGGATREAGAGKNAAA